jgi:hypothetical protein
MLKAILNGFFSNIFFEFINHHVIPKLSNDIIIYYDLTLPYQVLRSGVFVKIEPPYLATTSQKYLQLPRIHRRIEYSSTKTILKNGIIQVLH